MEIKNFFSEKNNISHDITKMILVEMQILFHFAGYFSTIAVIVSL